MQFQMSARDSRRRLFDVDAIDLDEASARFSQSLLRAALPLEITYKATWQSVIRSRALPRFARLSIKLVASSRGPRTAAGQRRRLLRSYRATAQVNAQQISSSTSQ